MRETITKVLSRPWTTDNQTFRDRCWTNKQSLVNSVNTQLTQMIIRGEAPDRAISAISKQFEVSRSKAGRLVMTESAYFSSAAQKDCFNALGVEKYRIVASFDRGHLRPVFGAGRQGVQDVRLPGGGSPLRRFHPLVPLLHRPHTLRTWRAWGERWTRNPDGTTTKVPANTTLPNGGRALCRDLLLVYRWPPGVVQWPQRQPRISRVLMQGLPASPNAATDALEQHYASGNQTAQAVFERYVQPGSVADGAFSGTPHF